MVHAGAAAEQFRGTTPAERVRGAVRRHAGAVRDRVDHPPQRVVREALALIVDEERQFGSITGRRR